MEKELPVAGRILRHEKVDTDVHAHAHARTQRTAPNNNKKRKGIFVAYVLVSNKRKKGQVVQVGHSLSGKGIGDVKAHARLSHPVCVSVSQSRPFFVSFFSLV